MRSGVAVFLGLLVVSLAQAEAPLKRFPFPNVGGSPVRAHYVRLEGAGTYRRELAEQTQRTCAKMGIHVELPPEGTPDTHALVERYYTPTHLVDYVHHVGRALDHECKFAWYDAVHDLKVFSPHGVCTFDLKRQSAFGECIDGGRILPLPALRLNPQELGIDSELGCNIKSVQAYDMRVERCVEPRPASEAWRSLLQIGGPDHRGLLLAERFYMTSSGGLKGEVRAVEVRRNISVGSDMQNLARSQGFRIVPRGGVSR